MLTKQEQETVMKLAFAWDSFLQIDGIGRHEIEEFQAGVHALQEKVLARAGVRFMNGKPAVEAERLYSLERLRK